MSGSGEASLVERLKRREAWLRLKTVQDFITLDARLRDQRREIDALNAELVRRNTYIHELHLAREAAQKEDLARLAERDSIIHRLNLARQEDQIRLQRAAADLEVFFAARAQLEAQLKRVADAGGDGVAGPGNTVGAAKGWLRGILNLRQKASPATHPWKAVPAERFTYFLRTSPFRLYREPSFRIEGWAFAEDRTLVEAVRARVDGREFAGIYGLPEPEVIAQYGLTAEGAAPDAPAPGLSVEFETPPGRHELSLEARLVGRGWVSFLTTPIWAVEEPRK